MKFRATRFAKSHPSTGFHIVPFRFVPRSAVLFPPLSFHRRRRRAPNIFPRVRHVGSGWIFIMKLLDLSAARGRVQPSSVIALSRPSHAELH